MAPPLPLARSPRSTRFLQAACPPIQNCFSYYILMLILRAIIDQYVSISLRTTYRFFINAHGPVRRGVVSIF